MSSTPIGDGYWFSEKITPKEDLLFPVAQFLDLFLHVGELAAQFIEIATRRCGLFFGGRLVLAARERREHRERPLEHLHVAPDLLVERSKGADAEGLRHLIAEFLLLACQR